MPNGFESDMTRDGHSLSRSKLAVTANVEACKHLTMKWKGGRVKRVDEFEMLGACVDMQLTNAHEVITRTRSAQLAFWSMDKLFCLRTANIFNKWRLFQLCVIVAPLWAAEATMWRRSDLVRIQHAWLQMLSRVIGVRKQPDEIWLNFSVRRIRWAKLWLIHNELPLLVDLIFRKLWGFSGKMIHAETPTLTTTMLGEVDMEKFRDHKSKFPNEPYYAGAGRTCRWEEQLQVFFDEHFDSCDWKNKALGPAWWDAHQAGFVRYKTNKLFSKNLAVSDEPGNPYQMIYILKKNVAVGKAWFGSDGESSSEAEEAGNKEALTKQRAGAFEDEVLGLFSPAFDADTDAGSSGSSESSETSSSESSSSDENDDNNGGDGQQVLNRVKPILPLRKVEEYVKVREEVQELIGACEQCVMLDDSEKKDEYVHDDGDVVEICECEVVDALQEAVPARFSSDVHGCFPITDFQEIESKVREACCNDNVAKVLQNTENPVQISRVGGVSQTVSSNKGKIALDDRCTFTPSTGSLKENMGRHDIPEYIEEKSLEKKELSEVQPQLGAPANLKMFVRAGHVRVVSPCRCIPDVQ